MKYTLTVTNKDFTVEKFLFEELEDARAAMVEKVYKPTREYIKDFDPTPMLKVIKLGKKKKLYTHQLPYEIISGSDYQALIINETNEFILGGVIAETAKIDRILADTSYYADIKFEDDDED